MKSRSKNSVKFGDIFNVVGSDEFSDKLRESTFHPHDLKAHNCIIDMLINDDSIRIYVHENYADVIQEITGCGECSSFVSSNNETVWEYPKLQRRYYRK